MAVPQSTKPEKTWMLKLKYSVTFEFDTRPPLTHRGIVEGASADACARRAVREARRLLKPVAWSSFVFVALERMPASGGEDGKADVREIEAEA